MKAKLSHVLGLLLIFVGNSLAQPTPRLVIGIVVDQMRPDYVHRYWNKLGNGGFKRLYNEGYQCANTQYNYVPTYTGPGHASIYTGTTPSTHGITGNNWYDRIEKKTVYCAADAAVYPVGTTGSEGLMSPKRLRSSTITDELEIATQHRAKVIGISIKDRGAILPAGHTADAAYWYDGSTGNFISSSWYLNQLPNWVNAFNERKWPDQYLANPWNTLLPIASYVESGPDSTPYEGVFTGETSPVFPHNIPAFSGGYDRLRRIPAGNTFTKDFALAAIKGEQMGKDSIPDFLCVSFSCTDYVGHQYGPQAVETEDTYLRLDRDLNDLFLFLDKEVGKGNYLLFLTADHGAMENPIFLSDNKIPGGIFNVGIVQDSIKKYLARTYNDTTYFINILNDQVHLNREKIFSDKRERCTVIDGLVEYLRLTFPEFTDIISACNLEQQEYSDRFRSMFSKGYMNSRSGDIYLQYSPGFIDRLYGATGTKGTTHGAPYAYDTHVPLYWMGTGISKGTTYREVQITDIAATLSFILHTPLPNGCTGKPILELLR